MKVSHPTLGRYHSAQWSLMHTRRPQPRLRSCMCACACSARAHCGRRRGIVTEVFAEPTPDRSSLRLSASQRPYMRVEFMLAGEAHEKDYTQVRPPG